MGRGRLLIRNKIAVIIPARLDSSRFPRKVLHKINNKTVIQHIVDKSSEIKNADIFVATCDEEIQNQVSCQVLMTSMNHTTATSRVVEAAAQVPEYEYIVLLQGDEILFEPDDINRLIETHINNNNSITHGVFDLTPEDKNDTSVVKAVINNNAIIFMDRSIDLKISVVGVVGIFMYNANVLADWPNLDKAITDYWHGLDTIAFIGKHTITPFWFKKQRAIDLPKHIKEVENLS